MINPVSLINDFVDEKLQGNINKLVSFDIAQLQGDRKYGSCNGSSFDCDNTNISRAIYALVFEGVWKNMNYDTLGDWKYRGDTINTFNTTFGKPVEEGGFLGLNHFEPDEKMLQRVTRFRSLYHTIGNFVVLPNAYIGRNSLNTFRGSYYKWRDYIDQFINSLYDYLTNPQKIENEIFLQLMELNKEDFEPYHGEDGFNLLLSKLLLDDCIDETGCPKRLFDVVYYWNSSLTREAYLDHVIRYIDFCEPFIVKRGKKIVEILESKIR
ncbi:MAG: hypothetical protein GXY64_02995 [Bacteroidales bacterium]|nr:hypothetical protein [Bacteroidales bacterium]